MSTNLNARAHSVTHEIFDILGVRPSGAQGDKVAQAIEQVIVEALEKSVERSTEAATERLGRGPRSREHLHCGGGRYRGTSALGH